jgi:hypothetical protein
MELRRAIRQADGALGRPVLKMGVGNLTAGKEHPVTDKTLSPLRRRISKTGRSKSTPSAQQDHIRTACDSNDEPQAIRRCGDVLDEQLGNSFVGQRRGF